jgi:hypothetical protein
MSAQPFYSELSAAWSVATDARDGGAVGPQGPPVALTLHLVNGPAGSDSRLERPFDHFDASFGYMASSLTGDPFLTLLLRGAVAASSYGAGSSSGLWGLYVNYDYISRAAFRVYSTNVGVGTTGQLDRGDWAFQGHVLLGTGVGAGSLSPHAEAQGVAQLAATVFYKDVLRFDARGREYLVGDPFSHGNDPWEDITYGEASLMCRLAGPHAFGLAGVAARRDVRHSDAPVPSLRSVSGQIVYALTGDPGIGRGRSPRATRAEPD